MSEKSTNPALESCRPPQRGNPGDSFPTSASWIAGVRYPSGTEIWCADRGGEAAWTADRRLATGYPSETSAAMAARRLIEGDAVPFWNCDGADQTTASS